MKILLVLMAIFAVVSFLKSAAVSSSTDDERLYDVDPTKTKWFLDKQKKHKNKF